MATESKTASDTEALKKDIEELRATLEKLTKDVGTVSQSMAEQLKTRATVTAEGLRDSAQHLASEIGARSAESAKAVESKVRENPVQSLLISFGVGLLLSHLFTRR